MSNRPDKAGWRQHWHDIIFEADTRAGRNFDVILLVVILASLASLMLESVASIYKTYASLFKTLEWIFTAIFSIEYIVRLMVVRSKSRYALSFYGIIDLLSILPAFIALVIRGAHYIMIIRSLRLIRVFRVLKMVRFLSEANLLSSALRASRAKIIVFLMAVVCATFILGTAMYLIEGPEHGFKSIPSSIYWCIVTLTTVGYGDISPQTTFGQIFASIIMILGYGIIAVPTGIVTSEMTKARAKQDENECPKCHLKAHDTDAAYCKNCGTQLPWITNA